MKSGMLFLAKLFSTRDEERMSKVCEKENCHAARGQIAPHHRRPIILHSSPPRLARALREYFFAYVGFPCLFSKLSITRIFTATYAEVSRHSGGASGPPCLTFFRKFTPAFAISALARPFFRRRSRLTLC